MNNDFSILVKTSKDQFMLNRFDTIQANYTKRRNYFAVFTLTRRPTPTLKMARRISLELPAHVSMMHSISATGRNLTDAASPSGE